MSVEFTDVVEAICEIRPDLTADSIAPDSKAVADLALDSLDMIQLGRILRKRHRVQLDFETWPYQRDGLGTILKHLTPLDA